MGAPNKYKKEYADIAENVLSNGKSIAAVGAQLNVSRQTIYAWRDSNQEFKDAIDRGLLKSQAFWEQIGLDGISGKIEKFGAAPWIFTMKNRFRAEYAEDKEEKKSDEKSMLEKILNGEIKIKHD